MKIGILFDGAGLARLGLEEAGHDCVGVEIDYWKHYLSQYVGNGNTVLADCTKICLNKYDAIWASPPCQEISQARINKTKTNTSTTNYLKWSLQLPHNPLWVENVIGLNNKWGTIYNAAQFHPELLQNRNRVIGGRYLPPNTYRKYKRVYKEAYPTVVATEYKSGNTEVRRAAKALGRKLSLEECALLQGFDIPKGWYRVPYDWEYSKSKWNNLLYEVIGNGVPVYMSKAFGEVYD